MDDVDDDDLVETKIVEIDVSPKNILIREYSGLLDELELDEDALDDSDDDYGGYAASTVPPAAKMEAGGGGGGSAFASTVVAAQSLASKVLAAKIEYDLSVKAVEETKEEEQAEGGEDSEEDIDGGVDTTSKLSGTELAAHEDVKVKAAEKAEEEEANEDNEHVEVYDTATSDFASTVFAAQNIASTGLTAQDELDLDAKVAEEAEEEGGEAGEHVEVYTDKAFGFASTVFAAQKRASIVPAAQTEPDVDPKATEETGEGDKVSENVDVYGDTTSGFAGTVFAAQNLSSAVLSGQDELELDPDEADEGEDGEAVEVYADTTSGFASTVFALQNLAGTRTVAREEDDGNLKTTEEAKEADGDEVREDVEGDDDTTSNIAATELAAQDEPGLDLKATEEAEDGEVMEDVEVYADTTSGFANTVFALQNELDVSLKAAEEGEEGEVREELGEHADIASNVRSIGLTGLAVEDELDLDPEVAEEVQGDGLARDSEEEDGDSSSKLASTGLAVEEEPGLDPKAIEGGHRGVLGGDSEEFADTSSNLASTEPAGQAGIDSNSKATDGMEGAELNETLGESADASRNPDGTTPAAQDVLDQNANVSEEAQVGAPGGDSAELAGASVNLAGTGPVAQDELGLDHEEAGEAQGGERKGNAGQNGHASRNLASTGLIAQEKLDPHLKETDKSGGHDPPHAIKQTNSATGPAAQDDEHEVDVKATEKMGGGELKQHLREPLHNSEATGGDVMLDELDLDPKVADEREEDEYDGIEFSEGLAANVDFSLDAATAGVTATDEHDFDPKVAEETEGGEEPEIDSKATDGIGGIKPSGGLGNGSKSSYNNRGGTGLGAKGGSRAGRGNAVNQGRKSKTTSRRDAGETSDSSPLPRRPIEAASPRKAKIGGKQTTSGAQGIPEDPQTDAWKRQVLVWFQTHTFGQSIDCDFKLRHKIANGYLVGACLAHYYPRMLDNEEFNRGNSPANKAANWDFVQKFMKRRGYGLRRQNIEILCMVPMPADSGIAAAHRVLLRLYAFLLADGLVPPVPGITPAKLGDPPARPKVPIYDRGRNEDEIGDDGTVRRNGSPLGRSPYRQVGPSRRAQPVPGDADIINHARRRLPQDFSDPKRERMWNNNTRALASTAAPGSTTADVAVHPKKSKGGTTTATGDDVIEGAGADRGDEGGATAKAGRVGRKGARWNTGKALADKDNNFAGKTVCGRCGRCNNCGRRRGGGRASGSEREDGAREIYGDRLPRNDGHFLAAARRGRYRGKTANDNDGPATCDCDGEHDAECAYHTSYARRRYGTRAGGGSVSPQGRRRKPDHGRKRDDGTSSPIKVSSPRGPSMPALSSPNAESPLGNMTGFGNGDGGWSDRVEERRQRQLLQRNRGAVRVAEVGDSGVIQPSAPVGRMPAAGQAISPTRLRRLVKVEATARLHSKILHAPLCSHDVTVSIARPYRRQQPTKAKAGQPSPPNAIDRNLDMADDRQVSSASLNEPATATPNTPSTTDEQDKLQDSLAAETPKRAGFNSYADYADEGPGSGAAVQWG